MLWRETFFLDISFELSLQQVSSLLGWYANRTKTGSRCYFCYILKWVNLAGKIYSLSSWLPKSRGWTIGAATLWSGANYPCSYNNHFVWWHRRACSATNLDTAMCNGCTSKVFPVQRRTRDKSIEGAETFSGCLQTACEILEFKQSWNFKCLMQFLMFRGWLTHIPW